MVLMVVARSCDVWCGDDDDDVNGKVRPGQSPKDPASAPTYFFGDACEADASIEGVAVLTNGHD
eukprot:8378331-Pyramimonas_sp.AAC.1